MDRDAINRLIEAGDFDALTEIVYGELRALAGAYMQRERANHTLQPTALANEVYLRLVGKTNIEWRGQAQFLAIAARAMRQILVDHARAKATAKRGGDRARLSLSDTSGIVDDAAIDVLDLDEALAALHELDPRKAQVVELRFFAGLTTREAAEALQLSTTTVDDDWFMARAWLRRRLAEK